VVRKAFLGGGHRSHPRMSVLVRGFFLWNKIVKVVFLTEGGRDIGFGHVTRCLSLYQVFEARRHRPEFIIAGDESVKQILHRERYRILNWRSREKELKDILKKADTVVVDSYLAGLDKYNVISDTAPIPVFIDDNNRLNYPKGIVVNWNIHASDLDYPKNNRITYLLGPQYISLRQAFLEVGEKKINHTVRDVMVTFGGDDSKNLTPRVLRYLSRSYPAMRKYVIIGRAFKNIAEIEAETDDNTNLIHSPDDTGMKEVMLKSDIAISSGGQTLYELARIGVPTVAVIVADNQRNNVSGWEKTNFIENAGLWTDRDIMVKIENKFKGILDIQRRTQSSEIGRGLVPGNGAEQIVRFIENFEMNKKI